MKKTKKDAHNQAQSHLSLDIILNSFAIIDQEQSAKGTTLTAVLTAEPVYFATHH